MLYDITRTIASSTAVWPGDSPYHVQPTLSLAGGASVNLTTLTLSPHTGTHADAYFHYQPAGLHPASMPLTPYIGPAQVVTVSRDDGPLTPQDFAAVDLTGAERLLIHSPVSNFPDDRWPERFPYLSLELVDWLHSLHIVLVGLDSPSVDAFDSTELRCHHALARYRMVNIELLQLRGVPDGRYELVALPLKLDQACGSPVRAVLRSR